MFTYNPTYDCPEVPDINPQLHPVDGGSQTSNLRVPWRRERILLIVLAFSTLCMPGCSDSGSSTGLTVQTPSWVGRLIVQFQNEPPGNPPRSIWRYHYRGETVYYLPPQCCDQFSELYDADGNFLCAPDGGFTGRGDGRCVGFFQERTGEVLVWKDPRTR